MKLVREWAKMLTFSYRIVPKCTFYQKNGMFVTFFLYNVTLIKKKSINFAPNILKYRNFPIADRMLYI